ncbi:MAG: tetratricopeptide repeat-containing sensor histidine kinase [Spirosomataceae bacterium]
MKNIIIIFFLFFSKEAFAQLFQTEFRYGTIPLSYNADSIEKALVALPSKLRLQQLIIIEKSYYGVYRSKFGKYLKEIGQLSYQFNLPSAKANYYFWLSKKKFDETSFHESLKYAIEADKLYRLCDDTLGMIASQTMIIRGNLDLYGQINSDSAVVFQQLNKVLDFAKQSKHPEALLLVYSTAGDIYYGFKKVNILFDYISKAEEIIKIYPQYHYYARTFLGLKARAYILIQKYSLAIKSYQSVLILMKEAHFAMHKLATTYLNIANVYQRMRHFSEAIKMANKALVLLKSDKDYQLNLIADSFLILSDSYNLLGNYKMAFSYMDSAFKFQENQFKKLRINDLNELEIKYEAGKKEAQNRILLQEKQLVQLQNQQYQQWIVSGIVFIILMLAVAFFLYRSNQHQYKLMQFRDFIFSIIAHDLRSPLIAFQSISLQVAYLLRKGQYTRVSEVSSYMEDSITHLLLLINNLLQWSLSQKTGFVQHQELFLLKPVWEDTKELYRIVAQNRNVEIFLEISDLLSIKGDKNALAIVFRNLLDNALKHTQNGTIKIQAIIENNTTNIIISDTGSGIPISIASDLQKIMKQSGFFIIKNKTGLGLGLINYLVKMHRGKVTFNSTSQGTTFIVTLPN